MAQKLGAAGEGRLSTDGQQMVCKRSANGPGFVKSSSGSGDETPLVEGPGGNYPEDWSLEGKFISYFHFTSEGQRIPAVGMASPAGERPATEFVFGGLNTPMFGSSRFSPDSRWVAYQNDESGRPEIFVRSFPEHETTLQISNAGGLLPTWRRDGKELFYVAPDGRLMSVDIVPGAKLSAGTPRPLFAMSAPKAVGDFALYDVTPDGQRFLVMVPVVHGTSVPINLVLNWPEELGRKP